MKTIIALAISAFSIASSAFAGPLGKIKDYPELQIVVKCENKLKRTSKVSSIEIDWSYQDGKVRAFTKAESGGYTETGMIPQKGKDEDRAVKDPGALYKALQEFVDGFQVAPSTGDDKGPENADKLQEHVSVTITTRISSTVGFHVTKYRDPSGFDRGMKLFDVMKAELSPEQLAALMGK